MSENHLYKTSLEVKFLTLNKFIDTLLTKVIVKKAKHFIVNTIVIYFKK